MEKLVFDDEIVIGGVDALVAVYVPIPCAVLLLSPNVISVPLPIVYDGFLTLMVVAVVVDVISRPYVDVIALLDGIGVNPCNTLTVCSVFWLSTHLY